MPQIKGRTLSAQVVGAGGDKGGPQGKRASKREKGGVKGKGTFQICAAAR